MDSAHVGHNDVKAAIDIALHDLLGGALRASIPSYYAINLMDPDPTAEIVREKRREGYTALQIKIGSGDVVKDAEVLCAAWAVRAPGVAIAADANRAMTTAEAIQLSHDLPIALEQPVRTMEEIALL